MNKQQSDAKAAPLIKFATFAYRDGIERVECVRETDVSVFVLKTVRGTRPRQEERREAKRGTLTQYHDTWADARQFLQLEAEQECAEAREALDRAQANLRRVMDMQPPKDPA